MIPADFRLGELLTRAGLLPLRERLRLVQAFLQRQRRLLAALAAGMAAAAARGFPARS